MMIVQCAWCRKKLREEPGTGISHGICAACERKVMRPYVLRKRAAMKATARGMNPSVMGSLWGGAKAGYYTYRAGRLEGRAKKYREKARSALPNPRTIPGSALEIRYRRSTDGKLYYHPFEQPVKMLANRDGSVTLRGGRRIWADDREPGFWQRYGHGPGRRNVARRRRRRGGGGGDNTMLWLAGGAALLFFWPQLSRAFTPGGPVSTGGQAILPQSSGTVWYSDPYYAGGSGAYFTGTLPPGAAPPWRLASEYDLAQMQTGLMIGSLVEAGGGLVAPNVGFQT